VELAVEEFESVLAVWFALLYSPCETVVLDELVDSVLLVEF
jgi:hypothetical protein